MKKLVVLFCVLIVFSSCGDNAEIMQVKNSPNVFGDVQNVTLDTFIQGLSQKGFETKYISFTPAFGYSSSTKCVQLDIVKGEHKMIIQYFVDRTSNYFVMGAITIDGKSVCFPPDIDPFFNL